MKRFALLPLMLSLIACQGEETAEPNEIVRTVLTVSAQPAVFHGARMSGTVRARFETPLAFQVPGRILARHVDAGQIGRAHV